MMKVLLAICLLFVTIVTTCSKEVKLISNEARVEYNGNFHYHYELGDGSKAIQDGHLKHFDDKRHGEVIEGKFAFIADDGKEYAIAYTADENGYRPVGAHLPTPPPIPLSVLRTLEYLKEHPYHQPEGRNY